MKYLVSACLLGIPCRYDGQAKPCEAVIALAKTHTLIPFCPEIYGGLATPRTPAELHCGRVVTKDGRDVTENYVSGAAIGLSLYRTLGCDGAICKAKSPSCGVGAIYDGTFTGTLLPGDGVTAALLKANGIEVYGESDIETLLEQAEEESPSLF